jgi:hypothetical protein
MGSVPLLGVSTGFMEGGKHTSLVSRTYCLSLATTRIAGTNAYLIKTLQQNARILTPLRA